MSSRATRRLPAQIPPSYDRGAAVPVSFGAESWTSGVILPLRRPTRGTN